MSGIWAQSTMRATCYLNSSEPQPARRDFAMTNMNTATQTMTPEAQRIAIAEACGAKWRCVSCASHASLSFNASDYEANWEWCQKDSHRMCDDTIPDYPADLNAMHEAEKVCFTGHPELWERYLDHELPLVCMRQDCDAICAPADLRCEAVLRTIGKWVE